MDSKDEMHQHCVLDDDEQSCLGKDTDQSVSDEQGSSIEGDHLLSMIGSFGRYQVMLTVVTCLCLFLNGAQILSPSWTMYAPPARCRISSVDGLAGSRVSTAVNESAHLYASSSQCRVCSEHQPLTGQCLQQGACPSGTVFSEPPIIPNSFAVEYDMGCESAWKKQLVWSMLNVGVLLGNAINGPLADRFGRRPVLLGAMSGSIVVCFGISFVSNLTLYTIMILLLGAITFAIYTPSLIIFMEAAEGAGRTWVAVGSVMAWTGGSLWLVFWAYVFRDRFWIQIFAALPALLVIPFYWILPESIRWLLAHGRAQEAEIYLRKAAKMNGREIIDKDLLILMKEGECESSTKHYSIIHMFKHWRTAKNTLINFFLWFAAAMGYYGLSQNTADLPSDPFLMFTMSALMELPAYFICPPLLERLGRRPTLFLTLGLAGISCITSGLLDNARFVIFSAMIGKWAISGAFACVYVYSAELFPTVVRHAGTGFSSSCARVGSLSAPFIRLLGDFVAPWLPIVVYGAVALTAAVLVLFLPETKGQPLPDTIQDAISYGQNNVSTEKLLVNCDTELQENGEACSAE